MLLLAVDMLLVALFILNRRVRRRVFKHKIHVITSHNVKQEGQKSIQSDVVIPNKLDNGKPCQGLRHWRLLSNLKNIFYNPFAMT